MIAEAPPAGAWQGIAWSLARDLKLALRSRSELGVLLLFYIIVVTLFPLGVGPEPALLRALGPGVLWVAALLASLLSLPRLFASDFADGTLEQIGLSPYPLPALISGKIAAHWASTGLPLVIASPLLGLQFGLAGDELTVLALGLLLGTPTLSMLGAIGAALTLGVPRRRRTSRAADPAALRSHPDFWCGAVDAVRSGLAPCRNYRCWRRR
jgi:heme exporter protein B